MVISSSFPILYVENVASAVEFYGGRLGFETVYSLPARRPARVRFDAPAQW